MPASMRTVTGTVGTGAGAREGRLATGTRSQTFQLRTTDPAIPWAKWRINDRTRFFDREGADVFGARYADVPSFLAEIDRRLGGH